MTKLAIKHGTDKWGSHFYTPHYDLHFSKFRGKSIKLLEIGVGGFEDSSAGGESLRMWKEYFPEGEIYSIDIVDKKALQEERIKVYQGSQVDEAFLQKITEEIGELDLIIDDGSHINSHIITTFRILFPILKKGGIYAIEDLHTSYWRGYGGDSFNLNKKDTAINFIKGLVDGLNYEEIDNPYYKPSYFDQNITSIHFYHNLAFIYKGDNQEGSNYLVNNRLPKRNKTKANLKYFFRNLISKLRMRS